MNQIYDQYKRCRTQANKPTVSRDPELSDKVDTKMRSIERRVARYIDSDAFQRFLADYVRDEYEKWNQDYDTDKERTTPLCRCSGSPCHLQDGHLPPRLQPRNSPYTYIPDAGDELTEYLASHPEEVVLSEALSQWRSGRADLLSDMRDLSRLINSA